jgi:hypothetical protein
MKLLNLRPLQRHNDNFTEKEILRTSDKRSETNPNKLEESQNSLKIKQP